MTATPPTDAELDRLDDALAANHAAMHRDESIYSRTLTVLRTLRAALAAVEADTRRVREELRKAEIDYESITSLPPFHAGMVSWSGADECGCLPDLRAQGLHMSRCERLRDGT